jgi:hypothetical protein
MTITGNPRLDYINTIQSLASSKGPMSRVPDALCRNEWLRGSSHVVLSLSPSVGAFSDWLITEDDEEPRFTREMWTAVSETIAWYAAYMDVLINR